MASFPDQGQAYDSSYLQALPTTEATIARAKIAQIETATLGSNILERRLEQDREAGAGPGGRRKFTERNIGDWGKIKIKEREKNEAATSRAKANTKRVTSTRSGVGGAVSASGAAQRAGVCSTRNLTIF